MKIKKINFYSVPRSEMTTCDCCGQGIKNICFVTSADGTTFKFGTKCFDKVIKDKLKTYQVKEMRKALKSIKSINEGAKKWETITEKEFLETWGGCDLPYGDNYEDITDFDKYKDFMVNEFFPYRLSLAEKELEKFSKIDF